ncbi:Acetyltransferase (GNAT) family protein [Falsiruegeria litorea R37]|uniref:Acetyltransferase (GNAT) family protein n=1 Tax=Falsiruegeria litorea R37 TaxID=1200284 RepID=A0A1Y5S2Q7_9RHOB|nr:GNAT family N-acetyltransferase [Falsiruegeria litorea]SLN31383.1 Acetyltransferase (GNAT) family protein [Falsiruegeria litorea R37]
MHVRATTRDDLTAVDALLARSYPKLLKSDYPPSVLVTALPLISRAQPALLTSGTYYLVETDGRRLLGAGGWSRDRQMHQRGHIRHVVTDFTATRRGVGRRLLRHVLAEAQAAGIRDMECWSTFTAEPFYRAMGFETLGPIDVPLQPGITFPAIRMKQRLL